LSVASDHNYEMLSTVAEGLGDELLKEVAFVGGSTTWLLCTDEVVLDDIRSTDDVDLVIELGGIADWQRLDCCAGVVCSGAPITWFTTPHCLANWRRDRDHRQLAVDPGRHRISRSFKARKNPDPEIVTRSTIEGEKLVFATDGFWADLDDMTQVQLLDTEWFDITDVYDDASWIVVQIGT